MTEFDSTVAELRRLHTASTQGEWKFRESSGQDCLWLDIVAGSDEHEILSAETMPQEHVVHADFVQSVKARKAQCIADLQFAAAAYNQLPMILERIAELEAAHAKSRLDVEHANKRADLDYAARMKVEAALVEARKDTERLDWLIAHEDIEIILWTMAPDAMARSESLAGREAIDAAREDTRA